jgi:hypothetical protein
MAASVVPAQPICRWMWAFGRSAFARALSSKRRLRSSIAAVSSCARRFRREPMNSAKNPIEHDADEQQYIPGVCAQAPLPRDKKAPQGVKRGG